MTSRALVTAAAVVLVSTTVCGCSAAADRASVDAPVHSRSVVLPSPTQTPTNSVSGGLGAGGAGSITVAISEPVAVSGHADTTVTCSTGRHYEASATSVEVAGSTVSFTVDARGVTGPGTYTATVTLALSGANAQAVPVPGIPVTLTDMGGSVQLSASGEQGTIAGSLAWACG